MVRIRDEIRERLAHAAGGAVAGVLQIDEAGRIVAADASAIDRLGQDPVGVLGQKLADLASQGLTTVQVEDWLGVVTHGGPGATGEILPDWELFTQLLATSRSLTEAAATVVEYAPQFLPDSQGALLMPTGRDQLQVVAQWPQGVASFDVLQMAGTDLVAVRLGRALSARLDPRLTWRGPQPAAMAPCFLAGRLVAVVVASGPLVPDVDSVESFARRVGAHLLRFTEVSGS